MKKFMLLPAVMAAALTIAASGRNNVESPAKVQPSNRAVSATHSKAFTTEDLQAWCASKNLHMTADGTLCEYKAIMPYGTNSKRVSAWYDRAIYVLPTDKITVKASGAPKLSINSDPVVSKVPAQLKITAEQEGFLQFSPSGKNSSYAVSLIEHRRCFSAPNALAVCP